MGTEMVPNEDQVLKLVEVAPGRSARLPGQELVRDCAAVRCWAWRIVLRRLDVIHGELHAVQQLRRSVEHFGLDAEEGPAGRPG
ncbi:hypothetical protein [Micromonospora sp. NPDC047730]|uniref:hypothetical protein n=1 Tax=Micromonospora sp. NPDC047730 TaxID=3364253 RepID=UPI003721148C